MVLLGYSIRFKLKDMDLSEDALKVLIEQSSFLVCSCGLRCSLCTLKCIHLTNLKE